MKTKNIDITEKMEITVQKTEKAIARIQRFVMKYGSELNNNQIERISNKIKELQKNL